MKNKSIIRRILLAIWGLISLGIIFSIIIDLEVILSTRKQITDDKEFLKNFDADCIVVLGAGVWGNKPSPMLEDRLLEGINLYNNDVANKIILTGDHGRKEYDEVNVMKDYTINKGIPSEDLFMDHAGFSTYDSIYRAKYIFGVKKMIIVTQKYHLYRALYIANQLGIEAYGVSANPREYAGQLSRDVREYLARNKEYVKCIFKPQSKYLGEMIPISGDGNVTNDK